MAEMSTYYLTLDENSTSTDDYDVDLDDSTITAKTCKGLLYALNLTNGNYTIILHPTENGFYFQNDDELKTGLNGAIIFNGTNHVETYSGNIVTVQGLQITGTSFMTISERLATDGTTIKNIYFKDCVHTMTSESGNPYNGTFYCTHASGNTHDWAEIKDCKFSIHIRQNDVSNLIINKGNWDSCSFYVEFSDLQEHSAPQSIFLTPTNMNLCSVIIRNASIYASKPSNYGYNYNIFNSISNSSLDLEFYKVFIYSGNDANNYSYLHAEYINNCFISIKGTTANWYEDTNEEQTATIKPILNFKGNMSGVNIVNKGDSNQENKFPTIAYQNSAQNYIKELTETQCKNSTELNKWGFFVNTVPSSQS